MYREPLRGADRVSGHQSAGSVKTLCRISFPDRACSPSFGGMRTLVLARASLRRPHVRLLTSALAKPHALMFPWLRGYLSDLVHAAVSKYQDVLSLCRQETILQRIGVELPRAGRAIPRLSGHTSRRSSFRKPVYGRRHLTGAKVFKESLQPGGPLNKECLPYQQRSKRAFVSRGVATRVRRLLAFVSLGRSVVVAHCPGMKVAPRLLTHAHRTLI